MYQKQRPIPKLHQNRSLSKLLDTQMNAYELRFKKANHHAQLRSNYRQEQKLPLEELVAYPE